MVFMRHRKGNLGLGVAWSRHTPTRHTQSRDLLKSASTEIKEAIRIPALYWTAQELSRELHPAMTVLRGTEWGLKLSLEPSPPDSRPPSRQNIRKLAAQVGGDTSAQLQRRWLTEFIERRRLQQFNRFVGVFAIVFYSDMNRVQPVDPQRGICRDRSVNSARGAGRFSTEVGGGQRHFWRARR